jgi:hypothetical protein
MPSSTGLLLLHRTEYTSEHLPFWLVSPVTRCKLFWEIQGSVTHFFFWQYWSLNSGPSPWATPPALFCDEYFWDRVSRTICPGYIRTTILLISVSWVARIIGMSHWHPAVTHFFKKMYTTRNWGCSSAVECGLSKYKVLGSTSQHHAHIKCI